MPQGLQVWAADASLQLDTSIKTSRIIGTSQQYATDYSNAITYGNITLTKAATEKVWVAGLASNCFFSAWVYSVASGNYNEDPNGDAIRWSITHLDSFTTGGTGILYYGVF